MAVYHTVQLTLFIMANRDEKPVEEKVDITILFKFIKPFDGSREKLNSFLTNCNNAYSLAAKTQKPLLFQYILTQLEGRAESACSIKEFDNWEQLNDFLKSQFGEKKHYAHLIADLQECRQGSNEPVQQYALRVETCLSKLLTEITLSNKKKSELNGKHSAMEDLALHTFLLGLLPQISNNVRNKDPSNLNEAINLAISEDKIIKLQHKHNSPSTSSNNSMSRPIRQQTPRTSNMNMRPMSYNQNVPFCRYCKTQGHTIDVCQKREFNNNRFKVLQNPSQPTRALTFNQSQSNQRFPNNPRNGFPNQRVHTIETDGNSEPNPESKELLEIEWNPDHNLNE